MRTIRSGLLRAAIILVPAVALLSCGSGKAAAGAVSEAVGAEELRAHVRFLASDRLGGRAPGTEGIRDAETYIAGRFRAAGLSPLPGEKDYFLEFTLFRRGYDREASYVALERNGDRSRWDLGEDFLPFHFSDTGTVTGPVVFAGYGITAPEYGWDDYRGLDVEGKIVLVMRHEPGEKDDGNFFEGTKLTRHSYFSAKTANARKHGAVGLLLYTDPLHHPEDEDFMLYGTLGLTPEEPARRRREGFAEGFLAMHVSRDAARVLLGPEAPELSGLQRMADGGTPPSELAVPFGTVTLNLEKLEKAIPVPVRNVAGYVPGNDPEGKDQWVVVGSHHDHLGTLGGEGDTIYNGADDNASGTAGVIELAEMFGRGGFRPARNIMFITFTSEEEGLLGSRALFEHDLLPEGTVGFMVNLDMIGRNPDRDVQISGAVAGEMREALDRAAAAENLRIAYGGSDEAGSDHFPFAERGVPHLFFFTGIHDDYHGVDDEADRIDYERMARIVRTAAAAVRRAASVQDRES